MSYQAVDAVLTHSKARGSDRLVLLVIASHADEDRFECYPGRGLLCREAAMSERNLIYCLNRLEAMQEITVNRGNGRGNLTTYQINLEIVERVQTAAPFTSLERVQDSAERVQNSVIKGAIEPDALIDIEPSGTMKKPKKNVGARAPDARTSHIAIQTCRELTNRYPPKEIWDKVIETLGDNPNRALLSNCRAEWMERGYNGASWKWATEWYQTGVPPRGGTESKKQKSNAYVGQTQVLTSQTFTAEDLVFMEEYIQTLIDLDDLAHLTQERNGVVKRGGPQYEWERKLIAHLEERAG